MAERLLVTIHDEIPADSFPAIGRLCRKLRRKGEGEVMLRQVGGSPIEGDGPPRFELFVSSSAHPIEGKSR